MTGQALEDYPELKEIAKLVKIVVGEYDDQYVEGGENEIEFGKWVEQDTVRIRIQTVPDDKIQSTIVHELLHVAKAHNLGYDFTPAYFYEFIDVFDDYVRTGTYHDQLITKFDDRYLSYLTKRSGIPQRQWKKLSDTGLQPKKPEIKETFDWWKTKQ